jgi:hypothetical protein
MREAGSCRVDITRGTGLLPEKLGQGYTPDFQASTLEKTTAGLKLMVFVCRIHDALSFS